MNFIEYLPWLPEVPETALENGLWHPVQPPPQALRFSHGRGERETRVTGDEPQGTMGRVQTAGEATSRPLSPSRLPLRAHRRETSGYEAAPSV